jgi:hypothetical protein
VLLISRFRGAMRRRPTQLRTALVAALCVAVTASAANSLIDLDSASPYAGDVGVLSTAWMRQPAEVDEFRVEPRGVFIPDEDELLDPPKHSQQPRPTEEPGGGPVALAPVPQPGGNGGGSAATPRPAIPAGSAAMGEILISRSRLMSLPTSGGAWQAMVNEANAFSGVNLSDQNDSNDVRLLAKALVTVRTGGDLAPVYAALAAVPGTEGGDTLALGRNLLSVVLAADVAGYRDPGFANWLRGVVRANLDGRTLISTHEDRPNNWGTHAGASRIAAALYLGDGADLSRAAAVFRGWLGERGVYAGFSYGDLDWQANPNAPVGINPAGATLNGQNVDGVLPDDQRRAGGFTWPPQQENYVYEALQGALLQAELLSRAGYPAYDWSNQALRRAYHWLNNVAGFGAEGDDRWQMPLVNARYGTGYGGSGGVGKNFAFTDWLYR